MVFSELLEKFNYNLYIFYINSLYKLCSVLYPIIKDIKFILSSYDKNKNKKCQIIQVNILFLYMESHGLF